MFEAPTLSTLSQPVVALHRGAAVQPLRNPGMPFDAGWPHGVRSAP